MIDDQGYAREAVIQAVATRLAEGASGKRLYRVNWNAVVGAARDDKELGVIVDGILRYAVVSKGKMAIYLDDIVK